MPSNVNLMFTMPSKIGIKPEGEVRLGGSQGMIGNKDEFSWEIENKDSISHLRNGGVSGMPEFKEFTFKKVGDSSSAALFSAFCKQAVFSNVELRCYKPTGENSVLNGIPYMKWVFNGFVITELEYELTEDGIIDEVLKCKYQVCHMIYGKQLTNGTIEPSGEFLWNTRKNSSSPVLD